MPVTAAASRLRPRHPFNAAPQARAAHAGDSPQRREALNGGCSSGQAGVVESDRVAPAASGSKSGGRHPSAAHTALGSDVADVRRAASHGGGTSALRRAAPPPTAPTSSDGWHAACALADALLSLLPVVLVEVGCVDKTRWGA